MKNFDGFGYPKLSFRLPEYITNWIIEPLVFCEVVIKRFAILESEGFGFLAEMVFHGTVPEQVERRLDLNH